MRGRNRAMTVPWRTRSAPRSPHEYKAVVVGLLATVVGLIVLFAAAQARTVAVQTFWSNAGAALITTGIVSLIYDTFLQASLLAQVRHAAGQADITVKLGLESVVVRAVNLDLARILDGARVIRIIPEDPHTWQTKHFSTLRNVSGSGCSIEIHLPTAEPYAHSLYGRHRVADMQAALQSSGDLAGSIARAWTQMIAGTAKPSSLSILTYPGTAVGGLLLTDEYVVISTGAADGPEVGAEPVYFVFRARRGTEIRTWAEETFARLRSVEIERLPLTGAAAPKDPAHIIPLAEEQNSGGDAAGREEVAQ